MAEDQPVEGQGLVPHTDEERGDGGTVEGEIVDRMLHVGNQSLLRLSGEDSVEIRSVGQEEILPEGSHGSVCHGGEHIREADTSVQAIMDLSQPQVNKSLVCRLGGQDTEENELSGERIMVWKHQETRGIIPRGNEQRVEADVADFLASRQPGEDKSLTSDKAGNSEINPDKDAFVQTQLSGLDGTTHLSNNDLNWNDCLQSPLFDQQERSQTTQTEVDQQLPFDSEHIVGEGVQIDPVTGNNFHMSPERASWLQWLGNSAEQLRRLKVNCRTWKRLQRQGGSRPRVKLQTLLKTLKKNVQLGAPIPGRQRMQFSQTCSDNHSIYPGLHGNQASRLIQRSKSVDTFNTKPVGERSIQRRYSDIHSRFSGHSDNHVPWSIQQSQPLDSFNRKFVAERTVHTQSVGDDGDGDNSYHDSGDKEAEELQLLQGLSYVLKVLYWIFRYRPSDTHELLKKLKQIMGDDRDGDKDDHDGGDKEVEEQRRNHIRQLREWIEQCRSSVCNDGDGNHADDGGSDKEVVEEQWLSELEWLPHLIGLVKWIQCKYPSECRELWKGIWVMLLGGAIPQQMSSALQAIIASVFRDLSKLMSQLGISSDTFDLLTGFWKMFTQLQMSHLLSSFWTTLKTRNLTLDEAVSGGDDQSIELGVDARFWQHIMKMAAEMTVPFGTMEPDITHFCGQGNAQGSDAIKGRMTPDVVHLDENSELASQKLGVNTRFWKHVLFATKFASPDTLMELDITSFVGERCAQGSDVMKVGVIADPVHMDQDSGLASKKSFRDLFIEAVFPVCVICRLSDDFVQCNANTLSHLESGEAHRYLMGGNLYAGSRAEGLAIEDGWGHPNVDLDQMIFYGAQLSVSIPQNHESISDPSNENASSSLSFPDLVANSCLEFAPEGCPPGYTRLRVTNLALRRNTNVGDQCMEESDGHHWLLPARFNELQQRGLNVLQSHRAEMATCIQGPAGQVGEGSKDMVPSLLANGPHPAICYYIQRHRTEWPPQEKLLKLRTLPACVVMAAHKKAPNRHQLTRMSWSAGEMILISELPAVIKQGYIAAKYTLKSFLKRYKKPDDGRSHVGSFHLKNTLLNYLEQAPPSTVSSPFALMMELLQKLLNYVNDGRLPLYFLPECNLLETVEFKERQIAKQAIQDIISDPVAAIVNCPMEPSQIYGDVSQEHLLETARYVLAHPANERSREAILNLLSRLDRHRQQRYGEQMDLDKNDKVSGRPKLVGLVDMMQQIEFI